RDIEILLHLAPGIREKRPVGADGRAKLIRLEQVVGGDGHETAVAHLHLAMELQESLVLPSFLWTETSAGEHQDQRIAFLQFRKRALHAAVIRELVVGKQCTGRDVWSHTSLYACDRISPLPATFAASSSRVCPGIRLHAGKEWMTSARVFSGVPGLIASTSAGIVPQPAAGSSSGLFRCRRRRRSW